MNAGTISLIFSILEAAISDGPTLVKTVEDLIGIYKSKGVDDSADWSELDALALKVHNEIQGITDSTSTTASDTSSTGTSS